jgi:hypothetical protein
VWGLTTDTAANAVLRQPYLGFGVLNTQCSCFAEKYNSLQVTLRKQFSHGVQAQAAYTWSNTMVNNYEPTSNGDVISEYSTVGTAGGGTSPGGRPQRLSINYGWNLPFGNPKGVLGKLVTGWNLAGVTTIQGGAYLNVTDGRGGTIFGLASSRAQLAPGKTYDDLPTPGGITTRLGGSSGGCGYIAGPLNTTGTLNGATCASLSPFVSIPTVVVDGVNTNLTGRGNVGQGVILGPGQFNFDASLSKMTRVGGIREDGMLQFRAEFFNALNHSQFSNPVAGNLAVNAGTFGQITSTSVNPRLIQLALKYVF